jgi:mannose-6-phosphate isomerase-like protein (cupin superfamily)
MSKGMDQRKKAAQIELGGSARTKALREFKKQLNIWKLVMPPHEPLVLDFGLHDFYKVGLIEYWIANEIKAGYCGKYLFVFDGQTCPMHSHKTKHETFFLVQGRLRVLCKGREFDMMPGDCLPISPRVPHSFTGRGPALLLEISKPCLVADNVFENPDIPVGSNYKKRSRI